RHSSDLKTVKKVAVSTAVFFHYNKTTRGGFMTFPNSSDRDKNLKGKCVYLMMLIKQQNAQVWNRLNDEFKRLKADESANFYEKLLLEYKQLQSSGGKDLG